MKVQLLLLLLGVCVPASQAFFWSDILGDSYPEIPSPSPHDHHIHNQGAAESHHGHNPDQDSNSSHHTHDHDHKPDQDSNPGHHNHSPAHNHGSTHKHDHNPDQDSNPSHHTHNLDQEQEPPFHHQAHNPLQELVPTYKHALNLIYKLTNKDIHNNQYKFPKFGHHLPSESTHNHHSHHHEARDYHHQQYYKEHRAFNHDHHMHNNLHHNHDFNHHHNHDFNHHHNHDLKYHHQFTTTSPPPPPFHTTKACPMFYTGIGDRCIAIITWAKMSWSMAKTFCHGMFGDLYSFHTIHQYLDMVTYLQNQEMMSQEELWISGHYKVGVLGHALGWFWSDGRGMPNGTPYWLPRSIAVELPKRQATNDFKLQYYYEGKDWCATMDSANFYYLDNADCTSQRSPVCVLRENVTLVLIKGSEFSYPALELPKTNTTSPETSTTDASSSHLDTTPKPSSTEDSSSSEESDEDSGNQMEEGSGGTGGETEGSGSGESLYFQGGGWDTVMDIFVDQEK